MLGSNPPRQPAPRVQPRPLDPPHRVLRPNALLQQVLSKTAQVAGNARQGRLGTKMGSPLQILDQKRPVHLLKVRPGPAPLEPAPQPFQLTPPGLQALLPHPSRFALRQVSVD